MERLRHLARAGPLEHALLVRESAAAMVALGEDHAALLLASRRLIQRHGGSGPLWWLCARMLGSDDPTGEAWRCLAEIDADPTSDHLARDLPADATVVVLGWPEAVAPALARRGDLRVLAVDALGEGAELARWLRSCGADVVEVPESGLGAAVTSADVVVLDAAALGPGGFLTVAGSAAAAAVAAAVGVPVWVAAGVGRVLPAPMWVQLVDRRRSEAPWLAPDEVVALSGASAVVRPQGRMSPVAPLPPDCPAAPELLSSPSSRG